MKKETALHLDNTSLLITHYNRSESLQRLLQRLVDLGITFSEIIVSDDCSEPNHVELLRVLQEKYNFILFTTPVNKGLGASLNVLHQNASSDYLFYVQEDFVPGKELIDALDKGLKLIQEDTKWDIIRFYAFPWAPFPYQKQFKDGFNELKFSLSPFYSSHLKFFVYSDHPHLKRKSFADKFGKYKENVKSDQTEAGMCRSFLKNKGKALYFGNNEHLFEHENTDEEPAQFRSDKWGLKKLKNSKPVYWLYLRFRLIRETLSYMANA